MAKSSFHSRSSSFWLISWCDKVWGFHHHYSLFFLSPFLLSLFLLELWMLESLRTPVVIFLFCRLHLMALNNITNFQINICSLDLVPEFHTIQSLTDNSTMTASQTPQAQTWTPIHPPLLPQTRSICIPRLISWWPFPPLCAVTHVSYCRLDWRCNQKQRNKWCSLPPTFILPPCFPLAVPLWKQAGKGVEENSLWASRRMALRNV